KIKGMGYAVKLDTNGTHPDVLRSILDAKLADYVAMDIKNSPEKYAMTSGLETFDLAPIRESVRLLMEGGTDYEFRTTAVAELHDDDSFRAIAEWIAGARRYYIQPFTDRETVPVGGLSAPDRESLERWAGIVRAKVPETHLRGI
ncbi:MAG: anaerobic ribonucleoside-triphosphate reductase activating protein, partial [Oscillospiraceae bacterium]|nr:anaerobic ribonucleoside-triphosphate reductase activating protein [Oscillospiraceae bacterium]